MCAREDDPSQHDSDWQVRPDVLATVDRDKRWREEHGVEQPKGYIVHPDALEPTDEVWDRARMELHAPATDEEPWYPGIDDLPKDRTGCLWIIVGGIVAWAVVGAIAYVILRKAGVL